MKAQMEFLRYLQKLVPEDDSFAALGAEVLSMSIDSFYRRMRGSTALTYDEAVKLARYFQVPLELASSDSANLVPFYINSSEVTDLENFRQELNHHKSLLQKVLALKEYFFVYAAKDIPVFYYFKYPDLATFKLNVWLKTANKLQGDDDWSYIYDIPRDILILLAELWEVYNKLAVNEIWNETTYLSLHRQISHYYDSGFIDGQLALQIIEDVERMYQLIWKQVSSASRWTSTEQAENKWLKYNLYFNEILILDNQLLCTAPGFRLYFLPYAGFNYMYTQDAVMTKRMEDHFRAQISKASHLSLSGEKERSKFFRKMENSLKTVKNHILSDK